jgi:hypothetical protein
LFHGRLLQWAGVQSLIYSSNATIDVHNNHD